MEGELIPELNINDEIKSKKLLVIAPDGVQIGVLELKKALIVAEELDLDLVDFNLLDKREKEYIFYYHLNIYKNV